MEDLRASQMSVRVYAEQAEWAKLIDLFDKDTSLASFEDEFHMLPLHWACTEPSITISDFDRIIRAFPHACKSQNLSGMVPLHVAIKNKLSGSHIQLLLRSCADACFIQDNNGKLPLDLALANELPGYTIDLIRQANVQTDQNCSQDLVRETNADKRNRISSVVSTASTIPLLMTSESMHSTSITSELRNLIHHLQIISTELRSNSASSINTLRSSSSTISSPDRFDVLWNPSEKLGIILEPVHHNSGARILKVSHKSAALGVETLSVGDVLLFINNTSVAKAGFHAISRFLKHAKVTCTLSFVSPSAVKSIQYQSNMTEKGQISSDLDSGAQDIVEKITRMLEKSLQKAYALEQSVQRSSNSTLCA